MANGFYHGYNVLKYRVLCLLYDTYMNPDIPLPGWLDGKEICEILGYDNQATLTNSLAKYNFYGYIARSKKRNKTSECGNQSYRWHITKKGIVLMFDLANRANQGFNLNRRKKYCTKRVDIYIGISKRGDQQLGLTMEDAKNIEAKFMPKKKNQLIQEQYV